MTNPANMTAREYAIAKNAEARAWLAEDPENRSVGLMPEDEEYWAAQAKEGLVTGADVERQDLIAHHYDYYKSVHGIRPRWINYDALSNEEIQAMINRLGEDLEDELDESDAWAEYEDDLLNKHL